MKTRYISLVAVLALTIVACGANTISTTAPSSGSLGMCAPGVPDCDDMVVENGSGGDDVAIPTGNAVNPQPVTDAILEVASPEQTELRFKLWMGVEPCDVIDSVSVVETATSVDVEILRGVGDVAATCIALAVERTIVVDLDAPLGDRAISLFGVALGA